MLMCALLTYAALCHQPALLAFWTGALRKHPHGRSCCALVQIDATFEDAETLQAMPRLVYALLRSPLLGEHPGRHPDTRAALHALWSALPPEDLQTAIYPRLSSYQDPNTQASLQAQPARHNPLGLL